MDDLKNTLKIDSTYRIPENIINGDEDLFVLDDLTQKEWDYCLPTLITNHTTNQIKIKPALYTQNEIIKKVFNFFPLLKNMNYDGILIAGGFVKEMLSCYYCRPVDIDIFFYGLHEEEAFKKIKEITSLDNSNMKNFIYNGTTITYYSQQFPNGIQFILRLYKNKSEILHGFDLGSSAVGFDGKNILFTSLSKFAYEYSCNILDTQRRSVQYESRLLKYSNNFNIIVPNLDPTKLIEKIYNKLPFIDIYLNHQDQNKLTCHIRLNKIQNDRWYDYVKMNNYYIIYKNIKNILLNENKFYYISNNIDDLLHKTSTQMSNYNNYKFYFSAFFEEHWNMSKFTKYNIPESDLCSLFTNRNNKEYVQSYVQEHYVNKIQNKYNELENITLINWIKENPGSQITSSRNPIIEEPYKWYGDFFIPIEF